MDFLANTAGLRGYAACLSFHVAAFDSFHGRHCRVHRVLELC